ncbi:hypothetical protein J2TS6_09600 [Paenibacillus albilobatus]|uniref:Uncharacterized protein n=1 Tax=Paenibacillus albilobatus TaxID=2716884 RepID=A0A919XDT6_9BACL|nr:hypothetical protein J2TS6_09600 [Paenibacillus albilobatus]
MFASSFINHHEVTSSYGDRIYSSIHDNTVNADLFVLFMTHYNRIIVRREGESGMKQAVPKFSHGLAVCGR